MSYTLTQPALATYLFSPGENLSWFEADSSNKNENSFAYTMRVQVTTYDGTFTSGSTGADVIGSFSVPPRPSTGKGKFSPSSVVKNYVQSVLDFPAGNNDGFGDSTVMKYRIIFGETYVNGSGVTVTTDNVTSDTYFIWDGVIPTTTWSLYGGYDYEDYCITEVPAPTTNLYLTDGPTTRRILENDNLYALPLDRTYETERNLTNLIGATGVSNTFTINFQDTWTEEQISAITYARWQWDANTLGLGTGATTLDPIDNVGEFSELLYVAPSTEYTGIGPIFEDDYLSFRIQTDTVYDASYTTFYELAIYGKETLTGNWSIIATPSPENNGGTIKYEYANILATGYDYIAFAFKKSQVAQDKAPRLKDFSYLIINPQTGTDLWWIKQDISTGQITNRVDIPYRNTITWINAGTDGIAQGATGDYQVWIGDSGYNKLSTPILYTSSLGGCSNCEKVVLTWLNCLGGYDTYEFNCLVQKDLEAKRITGERTLPSNYETGQRGRINSSNTARINKRVSTNWVGQEDADWLESLFMSTDVYETQPDRTTIPITINNNNYSSFVKQNKLKLIEFSYTMSYDRHSQIN